MSPVKQSKPDKEDNKDSSSTAGSGKDKEVIDLSLDEEATSVTNEGNHSYYSIHRA